MIKMALEGPPMSINDQGVPPGRRLEAQEDED